MLRIPAEQLVSSLTGEGDRHVLGREPGEHVEPERGQIGDRLVEMPGELVEPDGVSRDGQLELVMGAAEVVCDEPCVGELVLGVLAEADGERVDRLGHLLGHERDDEARVQPAREHRAERNVAHEAVADGHPEELEQLVGVVVEATRPRLGRRARILPVGLLPHRSVLDDEDAPRSELRHASERRPWSGDEAKGQVEVKGFVVEVERNEAAREDALQLGAEDDEPTGSSPVDGLDAEPIACNDGTATSTVPDGDAELSTKLLRVARAVPLVEVREDLRVAPARELMPVRQERAADLVVVVQLAVLHGHDRRVLAEYGLVAALDIDDRQAAHAERDPGVRERAAIVRPAMRHHIGHRVEGLARDDLLGMTLDLHDAANTAHARSVSASP